MLSPASKLAGGCKPSSIQDGQGLQLNSLAGTLPGSAGHSHADLKCPSCTSLVSLYEVALPRSGTGAAFFSWPVGSVPYSRKMPSSTDIVPVTGLRTGARPRSGGGSGRRFPPRSSTGAGAGSQAESAEAQAGVSRRVALEVFCGCAARLSKYPHPR